MTVRSLHEAASGEIGEQPPLPTATDPDPAVRPETMSFTYSDVLYTLPPPRVEPEPQEQQQEQESVVLPPPVVPIPRQLSSRHGGSSSSIFTLGGNSQSYLPNEFQVLEESVVPLLQNAEEKDEDFVIIAEFSELEGPIPLCTIPFDAPETRSDINLNSLSVHLMSTDYQVNTVGHFKVSEDTQVMRTNVFPKVHVFMQYFTLYDIKARGFVRPFCFGYASKDHVKHDRILQTLANLFNNISLVLKYANRVWFADELSSYLNKLSRAKEDFISRPIPPNEGDGEDGHFYFETGEQGADPISLNQIAYQFTEIENILKSVRSLPVDPQCISELNRLESIVNSIPDSEPLSQTLNKLGFLGDSFPTLNMPLLHPLKQKGESLRPITSLGQLGTLYLVQELMNIQERFREDVIFTEMTILSQDFQTHCSMFNPKNKSGDSVDSEASGSNQFVRRNSVPVNSETLCKIVEKLDASVPILPSDDRSGSYHTISDESDVQFPPGQDGGESIFNGESMYVSAIGSIEGEYIRSDLTTPCASPNIKLDPRVRHPSSTPSTSTPTLSRKEQLSQKNSVSSTVSTEKEVLSQKASVSSTGSGSWFAPRLSLGYSSEEDSSHNTTGESITEACPEVDVEKIPWWIHAAKTNIGKGDAGYGIRKFYRRFHKIGHHVMYSILIGRPVILCASAGLRTRISQLITALVPFVPCYPEKSFKILPWHQGTLSPLNFRHSYKLIGLCIPERSTVHDLVHSKEQNSVTFLDFEAKKIMGPAYNGNYLKNFEELVCQKKFFDDLSVLTYTGSIFAEIESQVFMFKSMQCDGEKNVAKIVKQLNLKNSDADIVKYLASIVTDPSEVVEIF